MNPLPLRSDTITANWTNSREQELSKLRQEVSKQSKIVTKQVETNVPASVNSYLSKEAIIEHQKQQSLDDKNQGEKNPASIGDKNLQQNQQAIKGEAVAKLAEIERRLATLEAERQEVIAKLSSRDLEVRQHEEAHIRVGQELAGTPSYETVTGPDGKKYIINGEVPIDVSTSKNPEETMQKMLKVMRAALAPAEPSPADHQVYSLAQANYNEARVLKNQLDAKIDKENYEKAKVVAEGKLLEQEDSAIKTEKLGEMAFSEAVENLEPEKPKFEFGKKRNMVVAVLQKMELFGRKNISAQEAVQNHFNWSSTFILPKSYDAGAILDIAA